MIFFNTLKIPYSGVLLCNKNQFYYGFQTSKVALINRRRKNCFSISESILSLSGLAGEKDEWIDNQAVECKKPLQDNAGAVHLLSYLTSSVSNR